ncbi:MAG TPA: copper resistance protein B [Candidatus Acidoferrum sp.]|nr:copper resistance protein B [Candidatus Acidoferrum sp.]
MRVPWCLLLLPLCANAAEHEHDHAAMAAMNDTMPADAPAQDMAMRDHGGTTDSLLLVERFERQQRSGEDAWQWQADYWYGGDLDKFWLKTEGSWLDRQHKVDDSDSQLLYSHAIAPFWDLQTGMRYSEAGGAAHTWAALGVQGLAPYWFHVDAALFAGDDGLWQGRVETSYELRLTQQWILEPRVQLRYAFNDDMAGTLRQGFYDSNLGLRLRYEIVREFAPYLGVEHDVGGQHQSGETRWVVGLRLWY